jgi:hypothetical protein
MAEPVRAEQAAPRLTLSLDQVDFAAGQLWRARYPTLIRHEVHDAAGLQLEPAFRVRSAAPDQEVEVVFRLAGDDVEFAASPLGAVDWQLLVPANDWPAPDVTVTLSAEGHRKECRVLWRRSGAPLTALLIRCRHVHGGPQPGSDAWKWTRVEGGVYLALVDRGDVPPVPPVPPEPAQTPAGLPVAGTVRVLGVDEHGRPVYDLFREDFSLPAGLALEPAFRAAPGEQPELRLRLDLPAIFQDVRFQVDDAGEVEMAFAIPAARPAHFVGSPGGELACTLLWSRALLEEGAGDSRQGRTANLYAMLDFGALRGALADAIEKGVDPTVIEPPACDASGVCSPPRRGEGAD